MQMEIWKNDKSEKIILKKNINALELRNESWRSNGYAPGWVKINDVGLDQFFTKPEVAKKCWDSFCEYIKKSGENLTHYKFVEPSAGMGCFLRFVADR